MDKTIIIGGKNVPIRKTGGTILRYKRQFGREFLTDLQKILALRSRLTPDATTEEKAEIVLSTETEWMYDILFVMAQQADPSIRDELEWLDSFEDFSIWEAFDQMLPLLISESKIAPKNA
ncbi:MAG: hypothetical protein J6Z40_11660 [Oscillospiraceae bacterium]|nr:hypothetical protein [Oscillospiraceae bacterium]